MTRHWVVGELADVASLLAAVQALRSEPGLRLETFTPHPVEELDGPALPFARVAAIAALGALALAPFSAWLAVLAAPALAALAVAIVSLARGPRPAPLTPTGYTLAAITMQGDVAETTQRRLEALGAKNVNIVIEAKR